jgi:ribosomal protein L11 methyltransferase
LRRVAVEVGHERLEEARATMLELFPEGFEEVDRPEGVELAAYTDAGGEERMWHFFGGARADDVPTGWEDRWRAFHQPVRVGSLWIGPPWETLPADALSVVVDPGRAFGTGSHPTTRLCLEFLQELDRGSLLDVGCGSGVLSIAAALLGFAPVTGIDVDAAAVEVTLENARANGVELSAYAADALADELPAAEIVVANVALDVVERLLPRVTARRAVLSGYLDRDELRVDGWTRVGRRTADGWAADMLEPA